MMTKSQMKTIALSALAVAYVLLLFIFWRIVGEVFADFLIKSNYLNAYGAYTTKNILSILLLLGSILLICKLSGMKRKDFGLTFGSTKQGLIWVAITVLYAVVFNIFDWKILGDVGTWYDTPSQAVVDTLYLLPSAFGEELQYRAVTITLLIGVFCGSPFKMPQNISRAKKIAALLVSTLLFGLAHMQITIFPFGAAWNWVLFVVTSLYGLFFGICFLRSKSLYWCGIAHLLTSMTIHLFATAVIYIYYGGVIPS